MNAWKRRYWAVIAAGGNGSRMGAGQPKQYRPLAGKTILQHSVTKLLEVDRLDGVFIGASDELATPVIDRITRERANSGSLYLTAPGTTRAATVLVALDALCEQADTEDWVLVHDAARPLVRVDDINRLIDAVDEYEDGGLLGWPVADSLGQADISDGRSRMTRAVARDGLWRAATPQMFRLGALHATLVAGIDSDAPVTDEAGMMCAAGFKPRLVRCAPTNFKITQLEDFELARQLIGETATRVRIGSGFDVHRLVKGRRLVLGGVEIPYELGLDGHSDADVLLHAITDACLGAAALGDLGRHFPDSDDQYRDADSRDLLREIVTQIAQAGLQVGNVDATVIAEAPRLAPFVTQMTANIAHDCGIDINDVNVKATTTEGLGFTGRGEGIAAQVSVTLYPLA